MTVRTFSGLVWQFSGTVGKGLLQVGFLIILARLVTPTAFGVVGAALVVVGLTSLFSKLGVGPALVHQPQLRSEHIRVGFSVTLILGLGAGCIVWFTSPLVAAFFRMEELEAVLRVLSVVFVLRGAGTVAESLLQRELQFKKLAVVDIISYGLGYGCVGVTLGFLGFEYWALVAGHLGQSLIQTIGYVYLKPHPYRVSVDIEAAKDMITYGGGLTLAKLGNYLASEGDSLMVGRLLGASALGVYGRAYSLFVTPAVLFGAVLDRVLFPAMATIQQDRDRLARVYQRAVGAVAILSLPASGLAVVLAPELVRTLLGEQWLVAIVPFQVLSLGVLFRTSYKISDSLARATGKVYRSAWRQAVYAALVLTGAGLGAAWGLVGVAFGILLALFVHFAVMAQLSIKVTGLDYRAFVVAHIPGLKLATVTTVVAYATSYLLRMWNLPSALIVICVLLLVAAIVRNALLTRWPDTFLGPEGLWALKTAESNLSPRLMKWVRP